MGERIARHNGNETVLHNGSPGDKQVMIPPDDLERRPVRAHSDLCVARDRLRHFRRAWAHVVESRGSSFADACTFELGEHGELLRITHPTAAPPAIDLAELQRRAAERGKSR
jgi:hypothetical protein